MGLNTKIYIRNKGKFLTQKEVSKLANTICEAFGYDNFFINDDDNVIEDRYNAIDIVKENFEDSYQYLEVRLATRYYGKGYERGDLPLIYCVAKWLEMRIPNCEILYDYDKAEYDTIQEEINAMPKFDKKRREQLFKYFVKKGKKWYRDMRSLTKTHLRQ